MGCQAVSSRIITIRLKASPFNVTIIQVYTHTSDYNTKETYELYEQLQNVIDQVAMKDILIVHGDWHAKVEEDATTIWNIIVGTSCSPMINDRGLKLHKLVRSKREP